MSLPTLEAARTRLDEILARGTVNLGARADTERLMLMLTRSCELRCGYCFVEKSESAPVMPLATATRAVDLLMSSRRSKLELQLFGGEPTRSWDVLEAVLSHAFRHPELRGRRLELILTTNGIGLDEARVRVLERWPVMVLFSLDGDRAAHRRFRNAHLVSDDAAYRAVETSLALLKGSRVSWFMNAVLPPSAGDEVVSRFEWAEKQGVPRLQINYAVGMAWSEAQSRSYLEGLEALLRSHHADSRGVQLFNWKSDCEPVILSDDLIVDVDGSVLHDGAIFLERAFPKLKATYRRGHLDGLTAFDPLRWDLRTLHDTLLSTYPEGSDERAILLDNILLGARVDLLIQGLSRELGRSPSRGARAGGKAV